MTAFQAGSYQKAAAMAVSGQIADARDLVAIAGMLQSGDGLAQDWAAAETYLNLADAGDLTSERPAIHVDRESAAAPKTAGKQEAAQSLAVTPQRSITPDVVPIEALATPAVTASAPTGSVQPQAVTPAATTPEGGGGTSWITVFALLVPLALYAVFLAQPNAAENVAAKKAVFTRSEAQDQQRARVAPPLRPDPLHQPMTDAEFARFEEMSRRVAAVSKPVQEAPPAFVYVLSNPSKPGLLKIGMTGNTPEIRANQVAREIGERNLRVEAAIRVRNVTDAGVIEREAHRRLRNQRVYHPVTYRVRRKSGKEFQSEWFVAAPSTAIEAIKSAARHASIDFWLVAGS